MPNIFKHVDADTAKKSAARPVVHPAHVSDERRSVPRPLPVPEVVEGSGGDTDWALWTQLVREQQAPGDE